MSCQRKAIAIAFIFIVPGPALAQVSFSGGTVAAGSAPQAITAFDFDNDGTPDLAVANRMGKSVSVLAGDGSGGFGLAREYPVGATPAGIAVADFDNDGLADIAVAVTGSKNLRILRGAGNGEFADVMEIDAGGSGAKSYSDALAVGDLNGDGNVDVAVNIRLIHKVAVLLGDGTGGFAKPALYKVGKRPRALTIGDFNGDGIPDIAVANSDLGGTPNRGNTSVLFGRPDGTFDKAETLRSGPNSISVSMADFNNDGLVDLAIASMDSATVNVFTSDGNGSFNPPLPVRVAQRPFNVIAADFNDDGNPDLAVVDIKSNNIGILTGDGNGQFTAPEYFAVGSSPRAAVSADFNNDGKPDLAIANGKSDDVTILLGQ